MRVFNKRTRIVEETLNIRFLENTPNVTGNGLDWLFYVDSLTISMNCVPVVAGNQTNGIAGTRDNIVLGQAEKKTKPEQEYILIPICITDPLISQDPKVSEEDAEEKPTEMDENGASGKDGKDDQATRSDTPVSAAGPSFTNDDPSSLVNAAEASNAFEDHLFERFSPFKNAFTLPPVSNVTPMDDTGIFGNACDDEDVGADADLNNLVTTMNVSPIPTTRIDKDHPKDQIIGDFNSPIQIRRMTKISDEHALVCYINKHRRTNHKDYQNCLFACFLSQMEPKKVFQALEDSRWIEAMQEELLQFQLQKVWTLVNLPNGKRSIGTKWVFRNKKDKRGIVVRNKARLMDVKSAFLYGTIEEEVYVCQPPGFKDPQFPNKVYKVEKALYGLHQAPKACTGFGIVDDIFFGSTRQFLCDEFEGLMHKRFQMSSMGELTFFLGLQVQQKKDEIFISQDKYMAYILKKFDFAAVKTASTPWNLTGIIKDEESEFQVTPKMSHLYAVKRIFRYLKGQPKLGLWYPRDSPFDLEAFSDSDYAGASLDRKSTTGGCQFLGKRLISWQCKKQTIVANSTTEAEYVAAANCCGQGMDTGGSPRRQETMGGALAQTSSERACLKSPYDYLSRRSHTSRFMAICTKLSKQVLDLEKEKDAQAVEILKLKQRVKKLERKRKSSISYPRRRIYMQVESSDDDLDEEDASKQRRESNKTKSMFQDSDFDVHDDDMEDVEGEIVHTVTTGVSVVSAPVTTAGVAISTAKPRTPPTTAVTALIDEDLTIAQTLIKMKEDIAKEKGVAIKDVEDSPRPIRSITTLQPLPTIDPKYKVKGVLVEEEPEKPEKLAELDRAQKERQKQEEATSAALAEEFDEIQARIDADHELAVRLTHEEQEKYTIEERARLLAEFFKRRKKQLAAERAEYTHQQLKHKNFEEVQKLYEREKKWIDDFKPIDDDSQQQAESTKKRPRADSEEESSKKQKLEEDNNAKKEEL
ncbi:putative ribonuclease H-like domain-containing protein [Tanacetum coccineum]